MKSKPGCSSPFPVSSLFNPLSGHPIANRCGERRAQPFLQSGEGKEGEEGVRGGRKKISLFPYTGSGYRLPSSYLLVGDGSSVWQFSGVHVRYNRTDRKRERDREPPSISSNLTMHTLLIDLPPTLLRRQALDCSHPVRGRHPEITAAERRGGGVKKREKERERKEEVAEKNR